MNLFQKSQWERLQSWKHSLLFIFNNGFRRNGELCIIGAISIDLNGMSDDLKIDQLNREERTEVVRALLKEFCANSTIHGVRYFADQKRHWIEKWVNCLNHISIHSKWIIFQNLVDSSDHNVDLFLRVYNMESVG